MALAPFRKTIKARDKLKNSITSLRANREYSRTEESSRTDGTLEYSGTEESSRTDGPLEYSTGEVTGSAKARRIDEKNISEII